MPNCKHVEINICFALYQIFNILNLKKKSNGGGAKKIGMGEWEEEETGM